MRLIHDCYLVGVFKLINFIITQGKKFVLNGKKLIPSKKSTKTILINDNTNESIPLSVEENAKNVVVNGNINESILPSFNESILQREIELHLPDSDVYDDFETNFSLMSNSKNTTETDNLISTLQNGIFLILFYTHISHHWYKKY